MLRGAAAVLREVLKCLCCRNVKLLRVFLHHSLCVKHRGDAPNGFEHQLQPGEGKFAVWFGVIKRNDLVLEQLIQAARVHFVLEFRRAVIDFGADAPAIASIEAFTPPAIEHTQVYASVRRRFHSAGATCFQRTQRMVQPKVDTLYEAARNIAVVVLYENNGGFPTWFTAEFVNLLDQRFACLITRMRFPSKNELHRAGRIVDQAFQSFLIAEQKCAALISSEPPRKTNRSE